MPLCFYAFVLCFFNFRNAPLPRQPSSFNVSFNMYLCMGFGQDFLLRKLAMHVARSMARPLTVNGQTLEERHQKTEV